MSSNEESSLLTPKQVPPMQPFIAMQQVVESKQEEEIPSPPPFFRVCGHFTALNPSRPMVFAKLMEQQFTNTDIQSNSNTNDLTKEEASMLEIPDLVGDVDIDKSPTSLVNIRMQGEDWSSSLEGMQALSIDLSNRNEPNYATCSQTTLTAKNHPVESLLSLSSVRMIPTPQGLALLLKQSNAATAVNHSQGLVNTTRTTVNAPPRRHARWTSDEDELLRVAVDTEEGPPHNWKRISQKYFQGSRNAMACKGRWNKNLQPGLVHDKWTEEEDKIILRGHKDGLSWPEIADKLIGRPPEQVRNRFLNDIDPTLNRKPFTEMEKRKVSELQAQYGNKWTQIASEMPGRSEKMVKNCWFNAKMSHRRKLRRLVKESAEADDTSALASLISNHHS